MEGKEDKPTEKKRDVKIKRKAQGVEMSDEQLSEIAQGLANKMLAAFLEDNKANIER